MDTQFNRGRYRGADGTPRTPSGGLTAAALGLAAALERGRQHKAAVAQPKASAKPAPAKASAPTFTGPLGRVQALHHAVAHDPKCRGKASAALALLCDDELRKVTPSGMVKLLQQSPATLSLPASTSHKANDKYGWSKIHEKLRDRRSQ